MGTQVRSGELAAAQPVLEFIPVRMLEGEADSVRQVRAADAPMNAPDPQRTRPSTRLTELGARRIEIVLPDGTCVRVDNQVGAAGLRG